MHFLSHPGVLRIIRFVISGGAAAITNIVGLYVFTEFFDLWYIFSACISFLISFVVSFLLQKFWTFRDHATDTVHRQAVIYFAVAVVNLVISILTLYILVEYVGLHYLLGQIIVMGTIATFSFFVYRNFIFKKNNTESVVTVPLWHGVVLISVALLSTLIPYLNLRISVGEPVRVPVLLFNDADYYYDRMHEIKDGYPFLGNPYFIEHRNDPPPAFFIADWMGAIPLLLGIPLMQVIYFNIIIWSIAFLGAAYLLLHQLRAPPSMTLFGAIFAYLELYSLLIRPVSMQIVFPFFLMALVAYAGWLYDPRSRGRQIFWGVMAAAAASLYTYSWQIILVMFIVTGFVFLLFRRDQLSSLILPFSLFVLFIAPSIAMTAYQSSQPFYAETLTRIGLIKTHLPIFLGFVVPFVPLSIAFVAYLTREKGVTLKAWLNETETVFFGVTAISIVGVMLSNIVTGLDLELPQHIERFIIVWFAIATIYYAPSAWAYLRISRSFLMRGVLVLLFVFIVVAHIRYFQGTGFLTVFAPLDVDYAREVQGVVAPLSWLHENVKEPTVVWTDPSGAVHKYLTMYTQHYSLFHMGGILHIISDREAEDRYLTSHYFSVSTESLIRDYRIYAGVGNALHPYKTHNRKVFLCRALHLNVFDVECGEMTDMVSYKGREYFDDLFLRFKEEIQPNIEEKLAQYGVTYVVTDNVADSETFKPHTLRGMTTVYEDERFRIYRFQ